MTPEDQCAALAADEAELAKPLSYAVEQRIRFIDFLFAHYGYVRREFLMDYFGLSIASASLDIQRYIRMTEVNVFYNASAKRYESTKAFKRLYP